MSESPENSILNGGNESLMSSRVIVSQNSKSILSKFTLETPETRSEYT